MKAADANDAAEDRRMAFAMRAAMTDGPSFEKYLQALER